MHSSAAKETVMRKTLAILVAVLLLGMGVAIGWFASTRFSGPAASAQSGKPAVSIRIGDPELLTAAPSWETWKYPESKVESSSTGSTGFSSGEMEFGATERIALVTPDEFDKVWAFYKENCQLQDLGSGSSTYRFEGNALYIKLFDDVQAHSFAGPKSDALTARAFTVHSLRYQLVGFVYRPKGATSTCVLLAYRPNKEFVSILRGRVDKE
jgi:hypothetical protein